MYRQRIILFNTSERFMLEVVLSNLWLAGVVVMTLVYTVWIIHLRINDASIIDLVWGAGFGLVASALLLQVPRVTPFKVLLVAMPVIWSVRYTTFIFHRNLGHGEDDRYTRLREKIAQKGWWWPAFSFVGVYSFQAAAMLLVSSPLIIGLAADESVSIGPVVVAGAALWVFGFFFEAIGDLQLEMFKKKHRDYDGPYEDKPVLDSGLWRYTRHPNYFGNACMWWGIGIVACCAPMGWVGLIGPAFMNFALVFLTGKANNESKMKARPAYRHYIQRTSGFFPLPPAAKRRPTT